MMVYKDPITGQVAALERHNKTARSRRRAAVWQDELNTGRYQSPSK
jgi:hypothetical protein